MRNPLTAWTKGHEIIASNAIKTVGLTATPVFNSPRDLCGICTAMDIPDLKDTKTWFHDKEKTRVNTDTIRSFREKYVHRADDSILQLPPITHEFKTFEVFVPPDAVTDYNETLRRARRIRLAIEHNGRAKKGELEKLMSLLQTNQQRLVSPILADAGALGLKDDPELVDRAASQETGCLMALRDSLMDLKCRGFSRVMVAACHTSLLKIADRYLHKNCPECGDVMTYDGSLTLKKRSKVIHDFLGGQNTVLLMSIEAGGTGLHLVPGVNAVIFWGSRPFSPMQVLQTSKRVHRIGQEHPVFVLHLVAKGSVDDAINMVHGDKLALSKAVLDMEIDGIEAEGGRWRTTGRIVDCCKFLNENGIFPEEDITEDQAMAMAHNSRHDFVQSATSSSNQFAALMQGVFDPGAPVALPTAVAQALAANPHNLQALTEPTIPPLFAE